MLLREHDFFELRNYVLVSHSLHAVKGGRPTIKVTSLVPERRPTNKSLFENRFINRTLLFTKQLENNGKFMCEHLEHLQQQGKDKHADRKSKTITDHLLPIASAVNTDIV